MGNAFKGSQARGQKGYGAAGMGDGFELDRVDSPQGGGKPYANDYQRSGIGPYTGGLGAFGKDPITRPNTDTGNRNREADIWAADGGGPAEGLAQKLPKPAGAPKSKRMTTALGDY
jgi:hypothetical protein